MFNCLDTFELDRLLDEVIPSIPSTTSILIIANFSDQDELSQSVNPAHIDKVKQAGHKRGAPIYYCKVRKTFF